MDSKQKSVPAFVGYSAALMIWIGAFVIGNILGRIVASLQGWENFSYDRPGAVFYSGMQSLFGAIIALYASKHWLGDSKFARFWLGLFVWIMSGMAAFVIIISLYKGYDDFISWNTLCLIVGLIVTEVVRRMPDHELF